MDWTLTLGLASLGICTGFLAGLLGIGGGMVLTPFLTMLLSATGKIPPEQVVHVAIATSMSTILFTSVSSIRAHASRGGVLWKVAFSIAPGILLGGLLGAQITSHLPTFWVAVIFAGFVCFSATKMLIGSRPAPSRQLPGTPGLIGAGGIIGLISSIVGAGGGFISVPFMTYCNVKIHNAIGTSAALGFPIALAGTVGYIISGWDNPALPQWPEMLGFVYLPALFSVAITSMLMAPVGASVAHRMDTKCLKKAFSLLLFALSAYMAYKAYLAF